MDNNNQYLKLRYIGGVFVVTILAVAFYISAHTNNHNTVVRGTVNHRQSDIYDEQALTKKSIEAIIQAERKRHLIVNATTQTGRDIEHFLHNDMPAKAKQFLPHPKKHKNMRPRIVGGTAAMVGEFPFYAKTRPNILCGATLVWEDILLTAAHCGGGFLNGTAIGGTLLNDFDATIVDVLSEIPHPDYNNVTQENGMYSIHTNS
jgi:hypothetical protein